MRKLYFLLFALAATFHSWSQNVTVSGAVTGNGSYATLSAAFSALNGGAQAGATITISIDNNTSEPVGGAILNANTWTSVTIQPAGGAARTISGAATAGLPLIDFNGADNVTINGLNTGGNSLTISNTTVSATTGTSTIRFIGGATSNTITNCSVLGSATMAVGTNGGNIFFSTDANTANGNDNNTISNCNIGASASGVCSKGVYGNGSTTTTAIGNSGISITNNNFFDVFAVSVTSAGVYTAGGCNNWTITNNRFYQTATRTWTTGAQHSPIWITNSSSTSGAQGFTITGNIIGYASNSQTGVYTLTGSTGKFIGIFFSGITGGTISNISNNTIASVSVTGVTSSGTGSSTPLGGIIISTGTVNSNNNIIGSETATGSLVLSTNTTTATDVYGIYNVGSDAWTATDNRIGGISVTNAAASGTQIIYGLRANTLTSVTFTANQNLIGGSVANSIQLNATGTSSQIIGIITNNAASTITNNTIRNLTSNIGTGTSTSASVIGISSTTTGSNHTVSRNIIHSLGNTNTSTATTVCGIQFTASTGPNLVSRNFIHSLNNASATGTINGINVSGGTTTYQNNMIRLGIDAAGNSITTGCAINGISEPLGTDNFYFNSVYVGGTGVGGSSSTYAMNSTQTVNTRNFRNNIFFNARSNGAGTGKHYAIRYGGSGVNPTGLTSNNNLYFANGTGAVFGFFNSADVADLAAWRTATGQDANSFNGNPQYINATGDIAAVDLHIDAVAPTLIESSGFDIPSVTDDFDGQTRSGLTPVDIGADAGNFVSAGDFTAPAISYTTFLFTCSTGDRQLNGVTITDVGGIPTAGGTIPRIYYRKGAGSWFSSAGTLASGNGNSGTWNFTIVAADMGGLAAGDVVQYYVIAQDIAGNIASNPSTGLVATDVNTVSTHPTTPNSYVINSVLTGTYQVGSGQPTFTTLTAAINAYNNSCLTGPVVFELTDALYSGGETFPITINQNQDASSTNTLTIRPAAGLAAVLSGSSATGALLDLNGADFIVINGVNTGGASLTIRNISTSIPTIRFINDASNNQVQNAIIEGAITTSTSGVILISTGTTTGNDNLTISNNIIRDRSDAAGVPANLIYASGTSATVSNSTVSITGNSMRNFTSTGVNMAGTGASNGADNWTISNNEIFQEAARTTGLTGLSLNFTGTNTVAGNFIRDLNTSSSLTGIDLNDVRNTTVSANRVIITTVNGSTSSWTGIRFDGVSSFSASATLVNNKVSLIPVTSASQSIWGIRDLGAAGNTLNVYYNSVLIGGTATGSATWAFQRGTSSPTALTLANNIFFNNREGGSVNHFAAGDQSLGSGTFSSNYNVFSGTGATAANFMDRGTSSSGTALSFASWQATTGTPDLNSFASVSGVGAYTITGIYVSATDLHANASTNPGTNAGTPIVGITTDFDGQTRNATTPDIGADEYDPPAGIDVGVIGLVSPAVKSCYTNNETVTVTLRNFSGTTIDFSVTNVTVTVTATGGYNQNVVLNSGTLASLATMPVSMPIGIDMSTNGTYTFNATAAAAGDILSSNDAMLPVNRTVSQIGGTYTVGTSGNFPTLTAAVAAYNGATCITGPITFNLTNTTYDAAGGETFPIVINANANAGTNTLTIRPANGTAVNITGTSGASASALIRLNGADYVIIDGINSGGSSLSIENTSTTGGTAVIWLNSTGAGAGATNNIIRNLNLKAGIAQAASSTITYGIVVSGSTLSSTITSVTAGDDNDNNLIEGNTITKVRAAIYFRGGSTTNLNTGNIVQNNIIGPSSANTDIIGRLGILAREEDGIIIRGNEIQYMGGNYATATTGTDRVGIAFSTDGLFPPTSVLVRNAQVVNNKIHDVIDERTFSAIGISVAVADGVNATDNLVANNMIYNVKANSTGVDQTGGILLSAGNTDRVVFNTIHLSGDTDPDAAATATANNAAGIAITSGTTVFNPLIRNNIVFMDLTSSSTAAVRNAAVSIPASFVWGSGNSNFNDWYVSGVNAQSVVGSVGGTAQNTLANWQSGASQDASSVSIAPTFVSATDLHLNPSASALLDNLGTPITGVTTDIDGDTRNLTTPDMGADEFAAPNCTGAVGGTVSAPTTTFCNSGTPAITASGYSTGTGSAYQWESSPDGNAWSDIPGQTNPAALSTGVVSTTTQYRLRVTCPSGTAVANSNILTITINANPTVAVTPTSGSYCGSGSVNLTASGANTYSWSPATGLSATTGASVTASPASTTIYTVTGTDGNGCTGTAQATITVNPVPSSVSITPASASICSGGPAVQLVASGGTIPGGSGSPVTSSGTVNSSPGNPYRRFWQGSKLQFIYTAAELTNAGLVASAPINSLSFNVTSVGSSIANLSISVGHTTQSTFPTTALITGLTTVYSVPIYTPVSGTNTHVFSSPFIWNGTDNLVFEVCYSDATSTTSSTVSATTAVTNSVIQATTSSILSGYCATNPTGTQGTLRPFIILGFGTPTPITWSPQSGLFTDPAATVPYSGGATTSVYALPSGNTTYTATATAVGGCTRTNTTTVTVNPTGTWLGTTSADWNNAANWCGGIPTSSTNVVISSGAPNMPVIANGSGSANNITINTGASLTVNNTGGPGTLNLSGNLANSGTFTATNGGVVFEGSSSQSVPAFTSASITMNGAGGVVLGGNATTGSVTFTNGHITLGNNNLSYTSSTAGSVGSHIIVNGTGAVTVRNLAASSTNNVPVATDAASFNPVTLVANGSHTTDDFTISIKNGVPTNGIAPPNFTSGVVDRTWDIAEGTAGGSDVNITVQWSASQQLGGFDPGACYVMHHSGGAWDAPTPSAATGSDPYTQTRNNQTTFSPFAVRTNLTPTPVTFLTFSGQRANGANLLRWTTTSEQNNRGFDIERSEDGRNFQTIGFVASLAQGGNSATNLSYQLADLQIRTDKAYYYRLRQVDLDGRSKLSNVVLVRGTVKQLSIAGAYPNPTKGQLNVWIESDKKDNAQLEMIDAHGRVVMRRVVAVQEGTINVALNLHTLAGGTYMLRLTDSEQVTTTIRIVRQ